MLCISPSTADGAGNLTSATINGKATSYSYNAGNQLTGDGTNSYSYDANGNETGSSAGLALAYNARNQTTSITAPGQQASSLAYLGAGQSELTQAGGASLANDLLGVGSRSDQGASAYYTRDDNGTLLGERLSAGDYYYLQDGLGSIVAVTDSAGSAANTYSYDPYGQSTKTTGTVPNAFGYAQGLQAPAGLYHFGQRYYDPGAGRWTQQDPAVEPGDPVQANRYLYAGVDPLNNVDPSGSSFSEYAKACGNGAATGALSGPEDAATGRAVGVASKFVEKNICDVCGIALDIASTSHDVIKAGDKAVSEGEKLASRQNRSRSNGWWFVGLTLLTALGAVVTSP